MSSPRLHTLQIPRGTPIHHLFSPTTLARDLSYVDNTYYLSNQPALRSSPSPSDAAQPKALKSQQSITRMHTMTFNRAVNVLSSISRLDLRAVGLYAVPPQLTTLTRLTLLDLSHNRLETLPTSIRQLKHLRQLNLSHNQITHIPDALQDLKKLTYLDLSYNAFADVPLSLTTLSNLTYLDLSYTRIDALPAELLRLSIATIKTDACPHLQTKGTDFTHSLAHDPPSLAEICARQLATPRGHRDLPDHLQTWLGQSKACFYCNEPYFENPVIRYRIVQQQDGHCIPVRYSLCSAHWSDDQDRILALFARRA